MTGAAITMEQLEPHLINIETGLKNILIILVAFFVWKVISVLYKLFGGVFFGGI